LTRGLAVFVTKPVATGLLMTGVLLVGILAYAMLPIAALPQVEFPTIEVTALLPGADPVTVASAVAQPLEAELAKIPFLNQMSSTSSLGSTSIVLQFDLDRNVDAAAADVQTAINAASADLPRDMPAPPSYSKVNPADPPILQLSAVSDTLPLTTVDDLVETRLVQALSRVEGVSDISVGGRQKPAIRIQLDPMKLAAHGLSLEDARAALAKLSGNNPKGVLNGDTRSYTLYTNGQLASAAEWSDAILASRDGAQIRVSDVGQAVLAAEDSTLSAWLDGRRAITLGVYKTPGGNSIEIAERIRRGLPELVATLPPSVKVNILADRTQTIYASLHDIEWTLLLNLVLVVAVMYAFLRDVRATLIPAVTVPLSLLGACAVIWPLGYSLDNVSLLALAVAVGFVVDDSIVMVENIQRRIDLGEMPRRAALNGLRETGFTIVSISVSLIAVLLPLLLMGGMVGRLFRELSVTLSITIVVSALVSLTVTPMLALLLQPGRGRAADASPNPAFDRFARGYARALDVALDHRRTTLAVFLATAACAVGLYVAVPKSFFPVQDTGLITGVSEAAQDISVEEMGRRQRALADVVRSDPAVEHCVIAVGGSVFGGSTVNNGRWYVTLKPRDQRDATAAEVIRRLRPRLAAVQGARLFLKPAQDISVGARVSPTQYQLTLQSADPLELARWIPRVLARLQAMPQLVDVDADEQLAGTAVKIRMDRERIARFGISPQTVDATLNDAFGQREIARYFSQVSAYKVILEAPPALQRDPASLDRLFVTAPASGELVPLGALAHWTTDEVAPLTVEHESRFPSVTISFDLAAGVSLGDATASIEAAKAELHLPATVQATFEGTAKAFQSTLATMPLLIVAALVASYLSLGILYESTVHPWTILSTLPSAGVGAIAALWIARFDFNLIGLVGVILLIGIVKKNGIMLVDFAIGNTRRGGAASREAVREASLTRLRPILMTTLTAMFGAVPLLLGAGTGSELRQPLGCSLIGGLLVSQLLTLFTTPVVYLYLDELAARLRSRAGRWRRRAPAGGALPEPAADG
jgi:HAE1 family hydrophobic/amphiphilic exporter-1